MVNFSTQCQMLHDSYLSRKESNMDIKIKFLSKIVALSFFTRSEGFPLNIPVQIFCGDINSDRQTLTASLLEVINDLNYPSCCVNADYFNCSNMLTVTVA